MKTLVLSYFIQSPHHPASVYSRALSSLSQHAARQDHLESLRLHNGHGVHPPHSKADITATTDMETDYNRHMDLAHRQRHPSLSPPRSRKDSQDSLSHYTHGQSPPPLKINDMNNIDLFATRAPQYHSSTSPLPKVNGRGSPLESRDYMSSRPKYLSTSSSAGSPPPRQRSPVRSPVGDHLKGNGEQERSKDKVLSPPITPTDLSVKPVRTSESGSPGMEERSSHGSRDDDMKMDHHQDLMEEDRDMDRGNQSDWTFEEQFKQVGLQIFSYRYIK